MPVAFLQAIASIADVATYTFAGQNLGAADANRYIIVCADGRGGGARTLLSITCQGVSSSWQLFESNNTSAAGIAIFAVPTGTTGDVVVQFSTTMLRACIKVYSVIGVASTTPHDSGTSIADAPTYDIDVPANGFAIATAMSSNNAAYTWTGLTEDYDETYDSESGRTTSASDFFAEPQTNLTVTATGSTNQPLGIFASWGPAGSSVIQSRRRRTQQINHGGL
jgi:hypothetical protein